MEKSQSYANTAINQGFYGCDSLETFIFPRIIGRNETSKYTVGTTFSRMQNLKTVKLPTNPTIISENAFEFCKNLTSINFENVTAIGESAFYGAGFKEIDLSSAPLLGRWAFLNNKQLTNIIFPDSVFVGYNFQDFEQGYKAYSAFSNCTNLESVKLPQGMTIIPQSFFYNCNKLSNVEFSNSITTIDNYAFATTSLNSPDLNEGLKTIGENAFMNCLTDLKIPSTLEEIGGGNLYPTQLKSVTIAEGNNHFMIKNNLLYSKDNKKIYCAIYGSREVNKYPGATDLSDDLVEEIRESAFYNLPITSYNFPALKKVGTWAFVASKLTKVTIKNGVEYGGNVFSLSADLTDVTIEEGVTSLEQSLFYYTGLTAVPQLPQSLKKIGSGCFAGCKITEATIKKGITYNGSVFENNPITKVTIEDGVTSLSSGLFYGCSALQTAPTLPRSLVSVGGNIFKGCKFTEITLPCNLTYFSNNVLPDTVNHIVCANPNPPKANYYDWDETYDAYLPNTTLEVPLESVDTYKNHAFWGNCKEIIGSAALSSEVSNNLPHGIYYAVKGGNICYNQDGETYDTGIASGAHPFNMQYYNNGIYVSDAGERHTYSEDTQGDGELFVVECFDNNFLKSYMSTHYEHNYDPYTCWIDTVSGTLYSCGRNNPVYSIDLNNHNWYPYNYSYLLENWQYLSYYNRGLAYAALPRALQKDSNGVYWMAFINNGNGIFRFKDSDIYYSSSEANSNPAPYPIIANGLSNISSMYLDEKNGYLYAFSYYNSAHGLYRIALADVENAKAGMSNWELIDNSPASPENDSSIEGVYVRQISGDGNYIYWSYIADKSTDYKSGIKRVNATGTPVVEYVVEDVEAYGFAIVPKTAQSGIENVESFTPGNVISIAGNSIKALSDVLISVYNVNGAVQSMVELTAGNELTLNLNSGVYIVKAITTDGTNAQFAKIAIK